MRDPILHLGIKDRLPDNHPLASQSVYCENCGGSVHAFNNETMDSWVETGKGNFCLDCFYEAYKSDEDCEAWGLSE